MKNNLSALLEIAGISIPPVGIYDTPDSTPFKPFTEKAHCIFEHYGSWLKGESTLINAKNGSSFSCPGAGYWLCGFETQSRQDTACYLAGVEGLKASTDIMHQWLDNHPPYRMENENIIISRLKTDQYEFLKTVVFFVNPDQLALLLTGAEYYNPSPGRGFVFAPYGSGCGQLLTLFRNMDEPMAVIGATDIAMRQHLPHDMLAFTVTKPMFEQLCLLDENSFLHKSFWSALKASRDMDASNIQERGVRE